MIIVCFLKFPGNENQLITPWVIKLIMNSHVLSEMDNYRQFIEL